MLAGVGFNLLKLMKGLGRLFLRLRTQTVGFVESLSAFVQFFFGQAEEVPRLLGEPLDVGRASYTTLSIHHLRFDDLARRLLLAGKRSITLAEKLPSPGGRARFRIVRDYAPPGVS